LAKKDQNFQNHHGKIINTQDKYIRRYTPILKDTGSKLPAQSDKALKPGFAVSGGGKSKFLKRNRSEALDSDGSGFSKRSQTDDYSQFKPSGECTGLGLRDFHEPEDNNFAGTFLTVGGDGYKKYRPKRNSTPVVIDGNKLARNSMLYTNQTARSHRGSGFLGDISLCGNNQNHLARKNILPNLEIGYAVEPNGKILPITPKGPLVGPGFLKAWASQKNLETLPEASVANRDFHIRD
jgi:hypothetical protein